MINIFRAVTMTFGVLTCTSTFLNATPVGMIRGCCRGPMGACARARVREREKRALRGLQKRDGVVAWQRRDDLDAN